MPYTRKEINQFWTKLPVRKLHNSTAPLPKKLKLKSKMIFPNANQISKIKDRKGQQYQSLFCSQEYAPIAFASNLHNEAIAIGSRVLNQTPPPNPAAVSDYIRFVKKNFDVIFPEWHKVRPVKFEDYLKHSNATPAVKAILANTKHKMEMDGVSDQQQGRVVAYQWTTRSSFVKTENQLYNSPALNYGYNLAGLTCLGQENSDVNKPKAPRLIQGARPEYICSVGPFFMAVQMMMKKVWGKKNAMYFTSGATNKEVSSYITSGVGHYLEDDVAAFDSSISKELCELELWMTKKFGASPLVLELFEANIKTHGYTHHGIQYKVPGTRKSGDPFTSVYNSILNGCMHLWAYCNLSGKPVASALREIKMIIQGDDNVLRHPGEKLDFKWFLLQLGFDCEAKYCDSVYDVEYCSNVMYETDFGFLFGPKLGRVLTKMGYFINPPLNMDPLGILRGVALGLEHVSTYIPLLQTVVERILELTWDRPAIYLKEYQLHMKYRKAKNVDNGYSLFHRYNLSPGHVQSMERTIKKSRIGDDLVHENKLFLLLFDRDTDTTKDIFVSYN